MIYLTLYAHVLTLGELIVSEVPTVHRLIMGDARDLSFLPNESVHLVITSPPYWTLKRYNENPSQLGHVSDYDQFLAALTTVWSEVLRVLVPGGRLVCVVGDVCLSRRAYGRHVVVPLHADICVACRKLGFDNLNPIIWHKIANANYEVSNGTKFLGKPYEPNAIIKKDIEFILMQRKPGGYRKPTETQRELSRLSKEEFATWFQQIWTISGASTASSQRHSLWNWRTGWSGCFRSREIRCWTHSAEPAQP